MIFCTESTTLNPSKGHLLQQWKQKVTSMFRNHHCSQEPYLLKHPKNHRRHFISCEKQGHTTAPGTCKLYFLRTTGLASKKTGSPWTSSWLSIIFIINKDSKSSKNAKLFRCEEHIRYNLDWSIPEDNFRNFHSNQNPKTCWQFGRKLPASAKGVSASNYYSSRKFLFNYHCQKTDTDTDKRESHRESERRGGVRGKGGKRARILRYIPCAISSRVSVLLAQNRTKASLHEYFERRRCRSDVPLLRPLGLAVVISFFFSRNNTFLKKPIRSRFPVSMTFAIGSVKCQEDCNKKEKAQTSSPLLLL